MESAVARSRPKNVHPMIFLTLAVPVALICTTLWTHTGIKVNQTRSSPCRPNATVRVDVADNPVIS
jgi:hypothetical protein